MIIEIINPSDPYTMETDSREGAALAALLLGQGKMGLEEIDGEFSMPIFLFGSAADVDAWLQEQFKCDMAGLTKAFRVQAAEALESVVIGRKADRAAYSKALSLIDDPEKRLQWKEHWLEERRSSMNNIGAKADRIAARLREMIAAEREAAPEVPRG